MVSTNDHGLDAEAVIVEPNAAGLPRLDQALQRLGDLGMLEILVEGGATLAADLWHGRLVDAGVTYLGGRIAGGGGLPPLAGKWATFADSRPVHVLRVATVGPDVRIDWEPVQESTTG